MLAPPPVMRYSPLADIVLGFTARRRLPNAAFIREDPRLFVCGKATAAASAMTTESAPDKNDDFSPASFSEPSRYSNRSPEMQRRCSPRAAIEILQIRARRSA